MNEKTLTLFNEATEWDNGSPLGGGSFGAMLFGGTDTEKIYLTEETIWSSADMGENEPEFYDKVQTLRNMYLSGNKYLDDEAKKLLAGSMKSVRSFEYAGILKITPEISGEVSEYKRELSLCSGVLDVSFKKGEIEVKEQAFCSYPYEVTAVKYNFSAPVCLSAFYEREFAEKPTFSDGILLINAKTAFGEHGFTVGIKTVTDGVLTENCGKLKIENANEVVFYISITTAYNFPADYKTIPPDILTEAESYDEILSNHIEDFSALFSKSDLELEGDEELKALPADKRIERLKNDESAEDFGLYELYFNFGKYLLISSSREGTFPANLQGVWAEKLQNPWNSDYHTNINLQMNYWPTEITGLSECHKALFSYMNTVLLDSGKKTAKELYHCRGTVTHHLSDLYGYTGPADGLCGFWQMGGAWLSAHLWEHYLFTLDRDFLKNDAYEYIKNCALFFIDYMFPDNDGTLLSGPSMSPENNFFINTPDGIKEAFLCMSPTMDVEIISQVLRNYIETENILGQDNKTKKEAEAALSKMKKLSIGKNGTLMEWPEDFPEEDPGHRHISHAYALYPGNEITQDSPELFEAVKKTLERRLSFGGGHTGWSRAWLINLFARLKSGDKAYENIKLLLTKSTMPNLLDSHPPFQIDGNFGGAAGIGETLLQSHDGYITLLPAIPENLSGKFTNLRARGNISVSAEFKNGKVTAFSLSSPISQSVKLKFPGGKTELINIAPGSVYHQFI
ncbi:MAG: glycoside hydrolase N-terminal domain-containing protein [Oscillospiraceae bacterium]|nr:glycoside hydrolase N-terminal domain-containing protein [Oscillospiraceae bacterium]